MAWFFRGKDISEVIWVCVGGIEAKDGGMGVAPGVPGEEAEKNIQSP